MFIVISQINFAHLSLSLDKVLSGISRLNYKNKKSTIWWIDNIGVGRSGIN